MKTLDELKAELAKIKGESLFEDLVGLINAEKSVGIEATHKKNKENEALRKFKKAVEALGFNGSDDELDSFTANLLESKKDKSSDSLTLQVLQKQIKTLTDNLESEKTKSKRTILSEKLNKALSDKIYGADFVIKTLINEGEVDLVDNKIVFKNGDSIEEFDTGIKKFLETNKSIVKTNQTAGSNTNKTNGVNQNLSEIINSGDQTKISNSISDIAKSLGIKI